MCKLLTILQYHVRAIDYFFFKWAPFCHSVHTSFLKRNCKKGAALNPIKCTCDNFLLFHENSRNDVRPFYRKKISPLASRKDMLCWAFFKNMQKIFHIFLWEKNVLETSPAECWPKLIHGILIPISNGPFRHKLRAHLQIKWNRELCRLLLCPIVQSKTI